MQHKLQERWNVRSLLIQGVARRVANELASEKLVLPFLYAALGGPVFFAGLFAPVVIVARLVAQLFGARLVEVSPKGNVLIAGSVFLVALTLVALALGSPLIPIFWLPAVFIFVSVVTGIGNGFGALVFQDLIGRILSDRSRVSLLFLIGAASGAVVIVVTLMSQWMQGLRSGTADAEDHMHILLAATAMMVVSGLAALTVREKPRALAAGMSRPGQSYLASLVSGMRGVLGLAWFRQFMLARMLLLFVEMTPPFFAVHAATHHAASAPSLTVFVISFSLGMIGGGLTWPIVSRRSIQLVLALSALVACLAATLAFVNHILESVQSPYLHAAMIFFLAFATQGALDGSAAYVVRSANDRQRPYCISVSNLAAGILGVALALGFGLISEGWGVIFAILAMGIINIGTAAYVLRLPDIRSAEPDAPA